MKLRTKIELTIGYAILLLVPVTLTLNGCKGSIHLYEAKMADTACYGCTNETYEIGSAERWELGDSVLVDETNFLDMDDTNGRMYVITKYNGAIPVK